MLLSFIIIIYILLFKGAVGEKIDDNILFPNSNFRISTKSLTSQYMQSLNSDLVFEWRLPSYDDCISTLKIRLPSLHHLSIHEEGVKYNSLCMLREGNPTDSLRYVFDINPPIFCQSRDPTNRVRWHPSEMCYNVLGTPPFNQSYQCSFLYCDNSLDSSNVPNQYTYSISNGSECSSNCVNALTLGIDGNEIGLLEENFVQTYSIACHEIISSPGSSDLALVKADDSKCIHLSRPNTSRFCGLDIPTCPMLYTKCLPQPYIHWPSIPPPGLFAMTMGDVITQKVFDSLFSCTSDDSWGLCSPESTDDGTLLSFSNGQPDSLSYFVQSRKVLCFRLLPNLSSGKNTYKVISNQFCKQVAYDKPFINVNRWLVYREHLSDVSLYNGSIPPTPNLSSPSTASFHSHIASRICIHKNIASISSPIASISTDLGAFAPIDLLPQPNSQRLQELLLLEKREYFWSASGFTTCTAPCVPPGIGSAGIDRYKSVISRTLSCLRVSTDEFGTNPFILSNFLPFSNISPNSPYVNRQRPVYNPVEVDVSFCEAYGRNIKPSILETCYGEPCPIYSWYTSEWTTCSLKCNGGTQTRAVDCRNQFGSIVSASNCFFQAPQPQSSRACNNFHCPTQLESVYWQVSEWGPCEKHCVAYADGHVLTQYEYDDSVISPFSNFNKNDLVQLEQFPDGPPPRSMISQIDIRNRMVYCRRTSDGKKMSSLDSCYAMTAKQNLSSGKTLAAPALSDTCSVVVADCRYGWKSSQWLSPFQSIIPPSLDFEKPSESFDTDTVSISEACRDICPKSSIGTLSSFDERRVEDLRKFNHSLYVERKVQCWDNMSRINPKVVPDSNCSYLAPESKTYCPFSSCYAWFRFDPVAFQAIFPKPFSIGDSIPIDVLELEQSIDGKINEPFRYLASNSDGCTPDCGTVRVRPLAVYCIDIKNQVVPTKYCRSFANQPEPKPFVTCPPKLCKETSQKLSLITNLDSEERNDGTETGMNVNLPFVLDVSLVDCLSPDDLHSIDSRLNTSPCLFSGYRASSLTEDDFYRSSNSFPDNSVPQMIISFTETIGQLPFSVNASSYERSPVPPCGMSQPVSPTKLSSIRSNQCRLLFNEEMSNLKSTIWRYKFSSWSVCDWTTGFQTRTASCVNGSLVDNMNTPVPQIFCSRLPTPVLQQPCPVVFDKGTFHDSASFVSLYGSKNIVSTVPLFGHPYLLHYASPDIPTALKSQFPYTSHMYNKVGLAPQDLPFSSPIHADFLQNHLRSGMNTASSLAPSLSCSIDMANPLGPQLLESLHDFRAVVHFLTNFLSLHQVSLTQQQILFMNALTTCKEFPDKPCGTSEITRLVLQQLVLQGYSVRQLLVIVQSSVCVLLNPNQAQLIVSSKPFNANYISFEKFFTTTNMSHLHQYLEYTLCQYGNQRLLNRCKIMISNNPNHTSQNTSPIASFYMEQNVSVLANSVSVPGRFQIKLACQNGFQGEFCDIMPQLRNVRINKTFDRRPLNTITNETLLLLTWEYSSPFSSQSSYNVLYSPNHLENQPYVSISHGFSRSTLLTVTLVVQTGTLYSFFIAGYAVADQREFVVDLPSLTKKITIPPHSNYFFRISANASNFSDSARVLKILPACSMRTCGSHGWCDSVTGTCVCRQGVSGQFCEKTPCGNIDCNLAHAHCSDGSFFESGVCTCLDGYSGPGCWSPPSCMMSLNRPVIPCSNQGTVIQGDANDNACENPQCRCPKPFFWDSTDGCKTCALSCGGRQVANGKVILRGAPDIFCRKCVCRNGYFGKNCEKGGIFITVAVNNEDLEVNDSFLPRWNGKTSFDLENYDVYNGKSDRSDVYSTPLDPLLPFMPQYQGMSLQKLPSNVHQTNLSDEKAKLFLTTFQREFANLLLVDPNIISLISFTSRQIKLAVELDSFVSTLPSFSPSFSNDLGNLPTLVSQRESVIVRLKQLGSAIIAEDPNGLLWNSTLLQHILVQFGIGFHDIECESVSNSPNLSCLQNVGQGGDSSKDREKSIFQNEIFVAFLTIIILFGLFGLIVMITFCVQKRIHHSDEDNEHIEFVDSSLPKQFSPDPAHDNESHLIQTSHQSTQIDITQVENPSKNTEHVSMSNANSKDVRWNRSSAIFLRSKSPRAERFGVEKHHQTAKKQIVLAKNSTHSNVPSTHDIVFIPSQSRFQHEIELSTLEANTLFSRTRTDSFGSNSLNTSLDVINDLIDNLSEFGGSLVDSHTEINPYTNQHAKMGSIRGGKHSIQNSDEFFSISDQSACDRNSDISSDASMRNNGVQKIGFENSFACLDDLQVFDSLESQQVTEP